MTFVSDSCRIRTWQKDLNRRPIIFKLYRIIKILSARSITCGIREMKMRKCLRHDRARMRSDEGNLRRILTRSRSPARVDQTRKERKGVVTAPVETLRAERLVERISFRSVECAEQEKRRAVRCEFVGIRKAS